MVVGHFGHETEASNNQTFASILSENYCICNCSQAIVVNTKHSEFYTWNNLAKQVSDGSDLGIFLPLQVLSELTVLTVLPFVEIYVNIY